MTAIALGEPHRIEGDVRLRFEGSGPARFRIRHTGDDEIGRPLKEWFDVSLANDRSIDPEVLRRQVIIGCPADYVDGDYAFEYRRAVAPRRPADWLMVVPLDEHDAAAVARCQSYRISIEPVEPLVRGFV